MLNTLSLTKSDISKEISFSVAYTLHTKKNVRMLNVYIHIHINGAMHKHSQSLAVLKVFIRNPNQCVLAAFWGWLQTILFSFLHIFAFVYAALYVKKADRALLTIIEKWYQSQTYAPIAATMFKAKHQLTAFYHFSLVFFLYIFLVSNTNKHDIESFGLLTVLFLSLYSLLLVRCLFVCGPCRGCCRSSEINMRFAIGMPSRF